MPKKVQPAARPVKSIEPAKTTEHAKASVYKAMQPIRVKFPDGVYRDLQPGDHLPPTWTCHNPGLWAKRGFIARIDGKPVPMGSYGPYEPPRPLTDADVKRMLEPSDRASPFPKASAEDIGPGKGRSAARDPSDAELDRVPEIPDAADPALLAELRSLSRQQLTDLAVSRGLKINASASKDVLVQTLVASQAEKDAANGIVANEARPE